MVHLFINRVHLFNIDPDMEKLLELSIAVCKKYGKEIKVIYGGEQKGQEAFTGDE